MNEAYRNLPSVDQLLQAVKQRVNGAALPHEALVGVTREVLAGARAAIATGHAPPASDALAEAAARRALVLFQSSLRPLINASGVIIQTNLGRAPLSAPALAAMQTVGAGYSNLEYDLESGERGSRAMHLDDLLRRVTGAEAGLAVNNNAAAIYLALIALAAGREVVVSRGQAVEIGGGFRIPDVLRASGATLVEVGTTNRTYIHDYSQAMSERTALLMRIHSSNFRLTGFVHETPLAELAELGQARGVLVLDDLGSGTLLPTAGYGLAAEPTVQESIAAGAHVVTFSGDKLLGGPQAGLIVGRADIIARLKRHPLARALRVDKTTIAGLEATLLAYARGNATEEIPVWRMIAAPLELLHTRAERIAGSLGASVASCRSAIGGGSLPGETMPSYAVALVTPQPDALAAELRRGDPPVVSRITEGRVLLDVRTILEEQDEHLVRVVREALHASGHEQTSSAERNNE